MLKLSDIFLNEDIYSLGTNTKILRCISIPAMRKHWDEWYAAMLAKKHESHSENMPGRRNLTMVRRFLDLGTTCISCGKEGVKFCLVRRIDNSLFWNLFSADEMLMTIDHIIPRSMGGTLDRKNIQPMCRQCNEYYGNKLDKPVIGKQQPMYQGLKFRKHHESWDKNRIFENNFNNKGE
jgi:hypothetical protein